jgi:steroid 5-alpha reductase family enzyme
MIPSPVLATAVDTSLLLGQNAAAVLAWMLLFWLISIPTRNVAIVDLAWGLGFVLVAGLTLAIVGAANQRLAPQHWVLPVLTTIWGLRLSGYLACRNHGRPEDKRYAAMRAKRPGGFWWRSLYIVFLLQGVVMWVVSLPIQIGSAWAEPRWTWVHPAGIAFWGIGFTFETVGDWQLLTFKRDPRNVGRVCDRGLWRYTRHPNYFGDFCVWWGLFLLADAWGTAHWTVISPLLMSVLLLKVSGVTLLEQSLRIEKPDYRDYVRRTNAFFPGPPRAGA